MGECGAADEAERESPARTRAPAKIHEWQESGCFSSDFNELVLRGDLGYEKESFWKAVANDIRHFSHREKVKEILLNDGYMSRASLEALAHFPNVEHLTLGLSPEGVTVPPKDLHGILKFTKLKYLYLALHGLKNEHFIVLSELKGLEVLSVDFGSRHMLGEEKNQIVKWSPAEIGDETARSIARMKSLKILAIYRLAPENGRAAFSEQTVMTLLDAPALKSAIRIDSRNFTETGLRALKSMPLPDFVIIDDLRPAQ